mgnify:CR=1 FL=1
MKKLAERKLSAFLFAFLHFLLYLCHDFGIVTYNWNIRRLTAQEEALQQQLERELNISSAAARMLVVRGIQTADEARAFGTHLTQILKKQAQIDLETIRVKGADAMYGQPSDLRQMYNDLKAYVGRENEEDKLL